MTALRICQDCRAGRHHHDRFTGTGADAGCPNLAVSGDRTSVCCCGVVTTSPPTRCPTCGAAREAIAVPDSGAAQ
jgi:hypothetical protein